MQYGKYVGDLVAGRPRHRLQRPAGHRHPRAAAVPVTVKLALVALVFEAVFGLLAGVLAGIRQKSFFDNLVLVTTTLIVSIPVFVLGFLAQYVLGLRLGLFPIAGIADGCTATCCRASCSPRCRWPTSPG